MDKIFIDEVVAEMHTIQDMLRWAMSRFNDAGIFYGHGTDNAWDEAVQLVLPALHLPPDVDPGMRHSRLTTSERHRIAPRQLRRKAEVDANADDDDIALPLQQHTGELCLVPQKVIGPFERQSGGITGKMGDRIIKRYPRQQRQAGSWRVTRAAGHHGRAHEIA